ncbi:C45 family autoproteolytic acyltransferase/hydolase [Albidovulum sp.]|uniref:C45 family autoproteolytic acyltransferase/hydolase n=1 Tax=Albidovulum sp. TaxID=1872424 RepID=UPI0035280923
MRVVDCAGTSRTRGRAHGETLRDLIADAFARWAEATLSAQPPGAPGGGIDAYCERFLGETALLQSCARETPDLHDEMAGIAEGANQPLHRLAAYNMMDEQWWFDARPATPPPGCSLIAMPVEGGHLLAQNMDLPGQMDGSQVALRLSGPDIPDTIVLSAAGLIGLTGANAAGVAVAVNTLLMLGHNPGGLPVAFVVRHALAARDGDEARVRLADTRHASGQHYAIATRDGVAAVECSAGGCASVTLAGPGRLLHTNHPLASEDIDGEALSRLDEGGFTGNSRRRMDWLQRKEQALTDAEEVRALLDEPESPICLRANRNGGSSTFASVLYEMTDRPHVSMRSGFAGSSLWQSIGFKSSTEEMASA